MLVNLWEFARIGQTRGTHEMFWQGGSAYPSASLIIQLPNIKENRHAISF